MKEWSKKTLEIVNTKDYLDRLQEIYPHEDAPREVDDKTIMIVEEFYEEKDCALLIEILLELEKFPYKESYVAFLRKDKDAITRNPKTVNRICNRLYEMGIDKVIEGIKVPKEANTRRGNQFAKWVKNEFRLVTADEFIKSQKGIVVLNASDSVARDLCNKEMGIGISKRPDFVAKSNDNYIVGEAKFLSSTGGNQGRAFDDGIGLATNPSGNAFKIFILDGIHWIETGSDQFKRISTGAAHIFTVLLLKEFLESFN